MTLSSLGETVRKHDPDRFLLSLFAPPEKREALWALYAFNYEIARTREVVTETKLGLIRLQWWRDAVGMIYAGRAPAGNPVIDALSVAIRDHDLPKELFENLIYAREFDLEDQIPPDMAGMVKYAEFTAGPLLNLSTVILSTCEGSPLIHKQGDPSRSAQDDNVKNIATAYALTGILRATPALLRQRRCYLPGNFIPPAEELYEGKNLEKLKTAAEAVVKEAASLLSATPAQAGVHRAAAPMDPGLRRGGEAHLKLHTTLTRMYLTQIKSAGYDLFSPRLKIPPFARELRLWWAGVM